MLYKILIMLCNFSLKRLWERALLDPRADLPPRRLQRRDILDVQVLQALRNPLRQVVGAQELAEGLGGRGEPVGHADAAGTELAEHFTQRSVLAAHLLHVAVAQPVERDHV